MKLRYHKFLCMILAALSTVVWFSAPQLVLAEKQYVKELIYSEDFNNVSTETLSKWGNPYVSASAEKGQWYSGWTGSTNKLTLSEHTGADDKCLSTSAHTKGTEDNVFFTIPGNVQDDGICKYEITFDYYANGSWCDWFQLRNYSASESKINMNYQKGWLSAKIVIDIENNIWSVGGAEVNDNVIAVLSGSDLVLRFRLHGNADTGNTIKFDNVKIYKLTENNDFDIYDSAVSLYDKFDSKQSDLNNVDIKLGKIKVDFGTEKPDETYFSEDTINLSGDVEYEFKKENNSIVITITSQRLNYDTTYTLTIDGLKTESGKTVTKKEFSFETIENKPIISDGEYIEKEDFEGWTNSDCSKRYNDSMITAGGFRTWTHSGIVSGKDGGKALTPMYGTGNANRSLQYYFVPKLENDTFFIDFDYYPGDIDNYSDLRFSIYRSKDGTGVTVVPMTGLTAFSGEWGHIRLESKPSQGSWSVVVTDGSGETVYQKNGTWVDSNVTMIDWTVTVKDASKLSQDANLPKIDNFYVNAIYQSGAKLTDKNLSVYKVNEKQDLTDVSPSSNRIVVDFGQRMMPDDMNKNNVYITAYDDPANPIETIDKYSIGKYELSPVDYLKPNKKYIVHINKCRNVSGLEMQKEYELSFETGNGAADIELVKLICNNKEVNSIMDLTTGPATLQIMYDNSTGEQYKLHYIIAFYYGNEMVFSTYNTGLLSNYAIGQSAELNITIPSSYRMYDEMDIIAWDSFSGMLPISKPLIIK